MRSNEVKTRRLDNLLCNIIFCFSVMGFCVFLLRILISGSYEFYHAVNVRKTHIEENKWLSVECTKPEFYANLKKHSQICDDVNLEKHDSIYLHALKDVMENLSFCGKVHCGTWLLQIISVILSQGIYSLAVCACVIVFCCMILISVYRHLIQHNFMNSNNSLYVSESRHNMMLDYENVYMNASDKLHRRNHAMLAYRCIDE